MAIVLLTLVVYIPAMRGGFIWDDTMRVSQNPALRNAEGLMRTWSVQQSTFQYYPLVQTTFWLEYHLWKEWTPGYHAVNLALQALNAVLLWLVLRRLGVRGAWAAALIFAVHPVQVESVAWITQRKNVLSGAFYLGAALSYLRFSPPDGPATDARRRWFYYALALVLFIPALLSKTVTASLPVALLLAAWWKRGRIGLREVVALAPFFAAGVAMGLVTVWVEKHSVGAMGREWSLSPADRLLLAGRALWFYAGKALIPYKLTFIYPRWQIDAAVWWQYVCPIGAGVAILGLWLLRRRIGRGPLAAVLFYAVTLAPALGFLDIYFMRYSLVADHWQYLPIIGIISLATGAAWDWGSRLRGPWRWGAIAAGCGVIAVLCVLTWRQCGLYKDEETLWRATIARNDGAWMAYHNLGVLQFKQGRGAEAIENLRASLARNPDNAEGHADLGAMLVRQGQVQEALNHLREAIRLDPRSAQAYNNLGSLLGAQGRTDEAIQCFRLAVESAPDGTDAILNLANALLGQGEIDQAINSYLRFLDIAPESPDVRVKLAKAFVLKNNPVEAAKHLSEAVHLEPANGQMRYQLAVVLALQSRNAEAIGQYREALRLDANMPDAMMDLAWLLATSEDAKLRNGAEALGLAEEACHRTRFGSSKAFDALAAAYAEMGEFSKAVAAAREALRLAEASGNRAVMGAIQGRLNLYRSDAPYRQRQTTGR